ncbi:MAG TPA: NAD(P) transhydrogenase subunit alpha [Acidimicrobiia bacterium]|nr:NAD(P) transhydrogenase subunit alpha [Acidimicrobiia bacterium]
MQLGVPAESAAGERRVAVTPEVVARLLEASHEVAVTNGAGLAAGFTDAEYAAAGAVTVSQEEALGQPVVAAVNRPPFQALQSAAVIIGFLRPLEDPAGVASYAEAGVTALAFELIPRITRAQPMDALSSQATVAGYQAAVEAAQLSPRFFPMLTTAAGTIAPARAVVLGAGVAGLQAIATCRRLGAVVSAFDVRAAAAEQVRSLGATFIEAAVAPQDASSSGGYARPLEDDAQLQVWDTLTPAVARADAVIATAAIPGRPAPRLITTSMVEQMAPGAVIVDLAATTGGNCELTVPGEVIQHGEVTIAGFTDLPSRKAHDASRMYARNVLSLLALLGPKGEVDLEDEILDACCVSHGGSVRLPQ